jgi:hypothetical protein
MTAAQQLKAMQEQMAAMAAMVASLTGDGDAPTDKTATTKAKAATVKRNLDPIDVDTGCERNGDPIVMRVIAANAAGPCANGARVAPVIGGKLYRTFDRDTVAALANVSDDVTAAIDAVDKRAKLGAHKVKVSK